MHKRNPLTVYTHTCSGHMVTKILCKNLNVKIKKIFHFSLGLTRFPKLIFYLNVNCKVEGPNPLQTAYLSSYLSTCYKGRSKFGKASTRVVVTVLCSSLNASSIMDWSLGLVISPNFIWMH
jgi:hypothetical protein